MSTFMRQWNTTTAMFTMLITSMNIHQRIRLANRITIHTGMSHCNTRIRTGPTCITGTGTNRLGTLPLAVR